MYLWCWGHLWNILLLFTHAWCHGSHAMSIILIFISTTIACLACCQKDLYVCCSFFFWKANVHRWCLHAYQQDMSWATALRFIMILDLSTTGEYVVLNECRYSYYPINFTLNDNRNKWCNRTWNTIFGFYCEKTFQLKRCHCLIYLLLKGYHSTLVISDSIILFKCPSLECIEATSNCVWLPMQTICVCLNP